MPFRVVQDRSGWLVINTRTHRIRNRFPTKEQAQRARRTATEHERKEKKR